MSCHVCIFRSKTGIFPVRIQGLDFIYNYKLKPQSIMDFSQNALKKAAKEKGDFRKKISRRSIVLLNE